MADYKDKESQLQQPQSLAELKLELFEYIDKKNTDNRAVLRDEFDRNVKSYKEDLHKDNKKYFNIVIIVLGILGVTSIGGIYGTAKWMANKTNAALENEVKKIEGQVSERLNKEFQSKRIQGLIEDKAKEYTEGRVELYISDKVAKTITPFSDEIRDLVKEGNAHLDNLREIIELNDAASFGSKNAYQKLQFLALGNSTFSTMAKRRIIVLNRSLSIYRNLPSFYSPLSLKKGEKEISAEKFSTNELFENLEDARLSDKIRHTLMVYIIKKPKDEICVEALRILKSSDSLPATAATVGILSNIFVQKTQFLEYSKWIKFCEDEIGSTK